MKRQPKLNSRMVLRPRVVAKDFLNNSLRRIYRLPHTLHATMHELAAEVATYTKSLGTSPIALPLPRRLQLSRHFQSINSNDSSNINSSNYCSNNNNSSSSSVIMSPLEHRTGLKRRTKRITCGNAAVTFRPNPRPQYQLPTTSLRPPVLLEA